MGETPRFRTRMTRIHSIDYLKLVLAAAIVWAHAVLLSGHFTATTYVFGQGLVRTAVPSFALISGFLFHATHKRGRTRRWLLGLSACYAGALLAYAPLWLPGLTTPGQVVASVLLGPLHLWYLAALIVAVLGLAAVLALSPTPRIARRWLLGLIPVTLGAGMTLQGIDFFTAWDLPLNSYRNGLFVEFPFAAAGYLIAARVARDGTDWLPSLRMLVPLLSALAGLRLIEAALSMRFFGLSPAAPPEFPPLAVAFSVTLLASLLKARLPQPPVSLGFYSMVVYFLHYLVLIGLLYLGVAALVPLFLGGLTLSLLPAAAIWWFLSVRRLSRAT